VYRKAQVSLATYAWLGVDLPASGAIASWVDAKAGVTATGAGTVPQVVTPAAFGGRKAVSFDGARWFNLGAAPALQELNRAVVAVLDVPVAPVGTQAVLGGGGANWYAGLSALRRTIGSHGRTDLTQQITNTLVDVYAQTAVFMWQWSVSEVNVNVTMRANAATFSQNYATGHAAIPSLAWSLGAFSQAGVLPIVANLADFMFFTGTDYATRAAQAFANARAYYGI
jgi:hypothetical protein